MSGDRTDRNPSPPQTELVSEFGSKNLLRADSIGDTVFSKHWVFTTLMKLLKAVEAENEGKSDEQKAEAETCGIEINKDLENDLCKLWDMSANEDVAVFLEKWKSPDILLSVIGKTNSPRVTEICMGIFGNMVCTSSISKALSEKEDLITLILSLLSGSDPPTLAETCRFLTTVLSHTSSSGKWLGAIKEDEEVFQHLTFILQSSTNNDLLHNAVDLIDLILDASEEIIERWASSPLVDGLAEAFQQGRSERHNMTSVILHALQLISTTSLGVDCLVNMNERVLPMLVQYITGICEEDVISIRGQERALASAIIVLNILVSSNPDTINELFKSEEQMFKNLIRIHCEVQKEFKDTKIDNLKETKVVGTTTTSNSEENIQSTQVVSVESNSNVSVESNSNVSIKSNVEVAKPSSDTSLGSKETSSEITMICLVSALDAFSKMILDLSEKNEQLKKHLEDKFEEWKDKTWLETLGFILDCS